MIALQIEDIRKFMSKMLLGTTFDSYMVSEISITTFASFTIDGMFHPEFFSGSSDDSAASGVSDDGRHIKWKTVRPVCLDIIKGKNLPVSFHIVLQLPPDETASLLDENDLSITPDDIFGFFLNISYRGDMLTVTTGSSVRVMSAAKAADMAWDRMAREFLTVEGLI